MRLTFISLFAEYSIICRVVFPWWLTVPVALQCLAHLIHWMRLQIYVRDTTSGFMWTRAGEAPLCSPTNSSKIRCSGTHRRNVALSKLHHLFHISVLLIFDYRQCYNMKFSSLFFSKHVAITINITTITIKTIYK